MRSRQISCCFTGHRPAKLPWGYRESDPRCVSLKRRIADAVEAAYQENCKKELRAAFGDHYECYYFYWMLNQDSQKDVAAGGGYPLQLGVKMTSMQAEEFEKVNEYRAEVGVDPLKFDFSI